MSDMCHSLRFWLALKFVTAKFHQQEVSGHFGISIRAITRAKAAGHTAADCNFVFPAEHGDNSWRKVVHDYGTEECKVFHSGKKNVS